ncbi:MAG: tRNA-guanine(34) transglycosylase [Candidatus Lloydbacteria bacterium RIFCSPHIGHO2_02_FULL_54_17]|uniref:Queuine tRNA-ribosyltransferase n=1 Tax=Candidatus Lloydbacteria bacterium RIFCSPHIGHO2_02_FULL_54_17 TaxID=1798664 RepID=A0A1G2DH00_9BACT|nr:MAG: tRNA-guanine(34) transglycosylase [Candidatus Lloydbacteria bacterium RIFCSPHIGHO2_02_FULL_54_17]OGZ14633.1 MAG: tRNA-guanine(34) transglycosylase [Candidatus Lloydbacteria bacterium RIFCSPLOWO2_02_FULL_54_12]OGZ15092.1 MAG: tRNA-guanine(34) transglycosylase [Candidatus Lloydbacteria bacterium RIFCSPLOWO2_01_FULL_54_18]
MQKFGFSIEKKLGGGTLGRAGVIHTPHGDIATPAFIVVGTKATVKALTPEQVKDLGAQAVLANTYHLYLQPGDELVRDAGGLGKFMHWDGPTFTDSGGFQVFSLGAAFGKGVSKVATMATPDTRSDLENKDLRSDLVSTLDTDDARSEHARPAKVDEDGVTFKSHIDGSSHRLTPERSLQIQHSIGADILFAFDECTSPLDPHAKQKASLDRTHRWAKRSLDEHRKLSSSGTRSDLVQREQALFGVIQGGKFRDLREDSARTIGGMDFDGFGIGGSFTKEDIGTAVAWVNAILPEEKPRHLLGIGEPVDLFLGVENGVDTFDCVAPTRMGRNGGLYTKDGRVAITNAKFVNDHAPVEKDCRCYTCKNFTRAYLAHLFRADEMLAATLASIHNLYFIVRLVRCIRESIIAENFSQFKDGFLKRYYG